MQHLWFDELDRAPEQQQLDAIVQRFTPPNDTCSCAPTPPPPPPLPALDDVTCDDDDDDVDVDDDVGDDVGDDDGKCEDVVRLVRSRFGAVLEEVASLQAQHRALDERLVNRAMKLCRNELVQIEVHQRCGSRCRAEAVLQLAFEQSSTNTDTLQQLQDALDAQNRIAKVGTDTWHEEPT